MRRLREIFKQIPRCYFVSFRCAWGKVLLTIHKTGIQHRQQVSPTFPNAPLPSSQGVPSCRRHIRISSSCMSQSDQGMRGSSIPPPPLVLAIWDLSCLSPCVSPSWPSPPCSTQVQLKTNYIVLDLQGRHSLVKILIIRHTSCGKFILASSNCIRSARQACMPTNTDTCAQHTIPLSG